MNAHVIIWSAASPLARCCICGAQQQNHGRPGFSCTSFKAETADDIDPADLENPDLLRHCVRLTGDAETASDAKWDEITDRRDACREEIERRVTAVFGFGFEDLRLAMGW